LDTASGEYFGVNEVGARIWTLLQEPMTFAALVDALLEEYRVDRDQCEEEVEDLLRKMADKDLIELTDPCKSP